jgi:hypothetical protein
MQFTAELIGGLVLLTIAAAVVLVAYMAEEEATGRVHEAWVDWGFAEAGMPA